MIILFTIFALLSGVAAIAILTRRYKSEPIQIENFQHEDEPRLRGLFEPDEEELETWQQEQDQKLLAERRDEIRQNLLGWAANGEIETLHEAHLTGDRQLYDEILDRLVDQNPGQLIDFISKRDLPSNREVVESAIKTLQRNATAASLTKVLRLAASTNSADIYLHVVESVFSLWDDGKLKEVSPENLVNILDTHYWLLAGDARVSGAGFLLKEKLAGVRREIMESNPV